MKHIQKKISLEQFKSRMPSIIPAFYDSGKYYEFDGKANFDDDNQRIPFTNYGMIPYSVIWDRGYYSNKCMSYNTIALWFHFIEFYINLLNSNSCSNSNYKTAVEYSEYENNTNYDIESYKNFDEKIEKICGTSNGSNLYENAKNTYNFMISKYFPRFEIDKDLQRYWNKQYLSINDVNYWIDWFERIKNEIGDINDVNDCPKTSNCCDCEKFFNLGGNEMLEKLKNFIESIEKQSVDDYCEPFFSLKIQLGISVDDLGEFSIFYESWDGGTDYSYSDGTSTNGAIVQYNNQDWVLENGKGYIYSNEFKEYYFGTKSGMTKDELISYDDNTKENIVGKDTQFSRRIEKNAIGEDGNIKSEFNGNVNSSNKYCYDFYGKKITFNGDVTDEICKNTCQKFPIIASNIGFFEIKGNIYECREIDYLSYNSNYYEVIYDNENNPIAKVNGVNYYGLFNGNSYTFMINGEEISISNGIGIKINDTLFIEKNGKIKYGSYTYNKVAKYCIVNGENVLLNNSLKIVTQYLTNNEYTLNEDEMVLGKYLSSLTNTSNGYATDNEYLYIVTPFTVYQSDEITGYTESKLSSFITATDVVYDNLGNKLSGTYIDSQELKDGDLIGLMYKPNTTIHLSKEYDDKGNVIENRYWGDYLEEIIIYFTDENNNLLTSEKKLLIDGNLLEIIDTLKTELDGKNGKLICKFVYYMGCVMNITKCADSDSNCVEIIDEGVKYVDVTELVEQTCKYFFNDYTCYILKYYDVVHDEINYKNDTYNFNSYVNKSQFSTKITTFIKDDKFACNGWVDFPVIREEYKLGSSSLSNVDVDVNIDRGTARAFDQHIKLLEVNSLESLEQYGNGYFNIITN